ncbi:hypothetical protein IQ266_22060 [filamentous cyanobacterium LEGE 11480]|uniref:Uncharacterized protein n=1 Tax=Romeriopsis navalis LEGE 11480 TaxID=2777977 RepID=A0A928VSX5_9CYAN|nr:hypothetical protein [Romeriopsis navalis]MBE9032426.1 hypothetical protein [Romeriopsis navalis LEGE 11480]
MTVAPKTLKQWHVSASVDPGINDYKQKYQARLLHNLKQKAKNLGFELLPKPTQAGWGFSGVCRFKQSGLAELVSG